MSIGMQAAAQGRAEMAFWPAAATGFIYANRGGDINLALLIVLAFTGAMTYITLKQIESVYERSKNVSQVKSQARREGISSPVIERVMETVEGIFNLLPNRTTSFVVVFGSLFINFTGGLYLLTAIGGTVIGSPDPHPASVGLFILPILYIFVLVSTIIWHI